MKSTECLVGTACGKLLTSAKAITINDQSPGPAVFADLGDVIHVEARKRLSEVGVLGRFLPP